MTVAKTMTYVSDARTSRYGLMVCNVCHKPIAGGEYRYYEKRDAYHSQHRDCTPDDPRWAELDAQRAKYLAEREEKIAACRAFYDRWQISDLSEYLPEPSA